MASLSFRCKLSVFVCVCSRVQASEISNKVAVCCVYAVWISVVRDTALIVTLFS